MKFKPKPSAIPKKYPSWAAWSSREIYLPAEFHSDDSFQKAFSIAKEAFTDSSIVEGRNIDAPLLLLGLLFREVSRALEIEPGEPSSHPKHLVDSPLGIEEMQKIEEMINEIAIPSNN